MEVKKTETRLRDTNMSKDWCDYSPEDDELLYSQEFNLMEELGMAPTKPQQTSGPSEQVVHTFLTLEELEREQLGPQKQQRSKEEDEKGMAIVMSRLEMASEAAQARAREEHLLKQLEELQKLREQDRDQHEEEKLRLLRKTKLIIVAHTKQMEQKDSAIRDLQTALETVKEELAQEKQIRAELEEDKAAIRTSGEILKEQLRSTLAECTLLKETSCGQKQLLIKAEDERTLLVQKNSTLEQELKQEKEGLRRALEQEEDLRQLRERDRDQHEEEKLQLRRKMKLIIVAHQRQLQDLTSELDTVKEERGALRDQSDELKHQLRSKDEALEALKKEVAEVKAEQKVQMLQKTQDAETQVQKMEEEKDAILRTCEELKDTLRRSQGEHAILEKRLTLQVERCSALEEKLRSTEKQCSLLEAMSTALEQELERKKRRWYRRLLCI